MSIFQKLTATTAPLATILIRLAVGVVFLGEGIQKFLYPDVVGAGRFARIPIPNPEATAFAVGLVEVVCGLLILLGLLTRLAAIPLIAIMLTAIFTTKIPILLGYEFMGFSLRKVPYYGIWGFLHESRTDLSMLCASLFLLIVGAGRWSLDAILLRKLSDDRSE